MSVLQNLATYTINHPGIALRTGQAEGTRRFIANSVHTVLANPFTLTLPLGFAAAHLGMPHLAQHAPLPVATGSVEPTTFIQHLAAWGMNAPGSRIYSNMRVEWPRRVAATVVNSAESLIGGFIGHLPIMLLNPVAGLFSWPIVGTAAGASVQSLRQDILTPRNVARSIELHYPQTRQMLTRL